MCTTLLPILRAEGQRESNESVILSRTYNSAPVTNRLVDYDVYDIFIGRANLNALYYYYAADVLKSPTLSRIIKENEKLFREFFITIRQMSYVDRSIALYVLGIEVGREEKEPTPGTELVYGIAGHNKAPKLAGHIRVI